MLKPIAVATAVPGTLDILFAITFAVVNGRTATWLLQTVATGVLGEAAYEGGGQSALLGLSASSRSTLSRYRSGEPLADSRDLIDRAGHLLGIHKSLRILFPHDRDLAYRWMGTPNVRFGTRPVDVVVVHGFEGLLALRRYLDFQRGQ